MECEVLSSCQGVEMSAIGLSSIWEEGTSALASRLLSHGGGDSFVAAGMGLAGDILERGYVSDEAEHLATVMLHHLEQDAQLEEVAAGQWPLLAASVAILAVARPEQSDVCDRVARLWIQKGALTGPADQRTESLVAWVLLSLILEDGSSPDAAIAALWARNGHNWVRTLEVIRQGLHQGETIDPDGIFDLPQHALVRLLAARLLAAHDGFGPEALCSWLKTHGFV